MSSFFNPTGQIFLANLSVIQTKNQTVQEQLSSGFQINQASDAPDEISDLLQLQAGVARNTQITTNLNSVQTNAQSADTALTNAQNLINQALSLGSQGAGSNATAITRQQLGAQVQSILQQIVSISQTSVAGTYIFSGDASQSPAYQLDPSSANGVDQLSTAGNTIQAEDSNGAAFATGLTAQQIFDARNSDGTYASTNVFASLTSLANALNNNDTSGISSAINSVQQSSTFVATQQAFYGTVENRVTQALSLASDMSVSLSTQISTIRDTNTAEAATELTAGATELNAALAAQSKAPTTSLFNFLG
jgi:flagellar hook-associated protein 3 FlgL